MHLHWLHAHVRVGFLFQRYPESRHARPRQTCIGAVIDVINDCGKDGFECIVWEQTHSGAVQVRRLLFPIVCRMEFDTKGCILSLPKTHNINPYHVHAPYTHTPYTLHIPVDLMSTPYIHLIYPQQNDTSSFAAANSMRAASDLVLDRAIRRYVRALHIVRAKISQQKELPPATAPVPISKKHVSR